LHSLTERQAHEAYAEYQNTVPSGHRILSFLEWLREKKIQLVDVSPYENSLIVK
jgi:hypothetical protein